MAERTFEQVAKDIGDKLDGIRADQQKQQRELDELKARQARPSTGDGDPEPERKTIKTANGTIVPWLTKSQRFSDLEGIAPLPDNASASDFSMGLLLKGVLGGGWKGAELERKSLSGESGPLGSFLLADAVSSDFIDAARAATAVMRAGAGTIPLGDVASLRIPRLVGDFAATWRSENDVISESDWELGHVTATPRSLATLARCSLELLMDSPSLADRVIRHSMTQALSLGLDIAALTGAAPNGPVGIDNDTAIVKPTLTGTPQSVMSQLLGRLEGVNEQVTGYVANPQTLTDADAELASTAGSYLGFSPRVAAIPKYSSTTVDYDADGDAKIYAGDWGLTAFFMRSSIRIEVAQAGGNPGVFERMQVLIRAYLRADFHVLRPSAIQVATYTV